MKFNEIRFSILSFLFAGAFICGSALSAPAFDAGVRSEWSSNFKDIHMSQQGNTITGTYDYAGGIITGELQGNRLIGWWSENDDTRNCGPGSKWSGPFIFEFSSDGRSFKGRYAKCSAGHRDHNGLNKLAQWNGKLNSGGIRFGVVHSSPPQPAYMPPSYGAGVRSEWSSNFKDIHMSQRGSTITGTYDYAGGRITGDLQGNRLIGWWSEKDDARSCGPGGKWSGPFLFEFSPDGASFTGAYGKCSGGQRDHYGLKPGSGWHGNLKSGRIRFGAVQSSAPLASSGAFERAPTKRELVADLQYFLNHPNISKINKLINKVANRIQQMEGSDTGLFKTLNTTWRPHYAELKNKLLPKSAKAARLMREVHPKTPEMKRITDVMTQAMNMFHQGIQDFVTAIPIEDADLFKQGLAKIKKVAVLKKTATNMAEKLAAKVKNMPDTAPPKHTHQVPPPPPPAVTKAPAPPPAVTKPPVSPTKPPVSLSVESGPLSAAGIWDAGEPFGTMTLDQFDTMVDGAFSKHNGKFEGELTGNLLSGVWSADQSATKCDKKRLGSFYWGNIQAAISSNGKKIHGKWGSCGLMPDISFSADKAP